MHDERQRRKEGPMCLSARTYDVRRTIEQKRQWNCTSEISPIPNCCNRTTFEHCLCLLLTSLAFPGPMQRKTELEPNHDIGGNNAAVVRSLFQVVTDVQSDSIC